MPLFSRRPDGVLLSRLPGFRKMFPYIMPTRTESTIVHQQVIPVARALALLDRLNEGRKPRITLFHVVLAATLRVMAERPENNRFVVGRRIYQRKEIVFSFVAKKELTESSAETNVKLVFPPTDTLVDVAGRTFTAVRSAKGSSQAKDESLTDRLTRLPRGILRVVIWAYRALDYLSWLPAREIQDDPMYCSAFFANLGSIGLDAVNHHLFEWGTCPFFVVLGSVKKAVVVGEEGAPVVADVVTASFTLDERITDGVNLARTIQRFTALLEDPEELLTPPRDLPDPFREA